MARKSSSKNERSIGNRSVLSERIALRVSKKARVKIHRVIAHCAFDCPLREILLILPVERERSIFDHRSEEFFDGSLHSAHPSVVALLTDAGYPDLLAVRDFGRRISHLAIERLASLNTFENPAREQVLFRVSRSSAKDAWRRHTANSNSGYSAVDV
jgi:hypothetical protein